jgi:hypothetical protein
MEKRGTHNPAGDLRGGKYSNFEGGTRVPFLAQWPGKLKWFPTQVARASSSTRVLNFPENPASFSRRDDEALAPLVIGTPGNCSWFALTSLAKFLLRMW